MDEGLADPQRLTEFAVPDATFDLGAFSAVVERSEMRSAKRSEMRSLDDFLQFRAAWIEPYDDWSYKPEKVVDAGTNRVELRSPDQALIEHIDDAIAHFDPWQGSTTKRFLAIELAEQIG